MLRPLKETLDGLSRFLAVQLWAHIRRHAGRRIWTRFGVRGPALCRIPDRSYPRILTMTMVLLSLWVMTVNADIQLNEFMASNRDMLADANGNFGDWIELYNTGPNTVDVAGMYLTDNAQDPTQWQFPTDRPNLTQIPAQGTLLLWADNSASTSEELHTNFKLSVQGEFLGLIHSDGVTWIDQIEFDGQRPNVSYGRSANGDDWGYMQTATPDSSNDLIYEGWTTPPSVSLSHGFYDEPVTVTLTAHDPGAYIVYTLDGSSPLVETSFMPNGQIYDGPLTLSGNTCLRAVTWRLGSMVSDVLTQTYLFLEDTKTQSPNGERPNEAWPQGWVSGQRLDYGMDPDIVNHTAYAEQMDEALLSLPSLSIVTDLANLFDEDTGIYVHCGGYTGERGKAWERPVSLELIHPDGSEGFQADLGLRMRGITSCDGSNPKHAFRFLFDSVYGQAPLEYPLFDDGVQIFQKIDLRCAANYSWSMEGNTRHTYVREVFSRDLQGAMGQPHTRSRYYHLYLNGQYWGVYQTQERAEATYAANTFGGEREDYDVVKTNQEWYRSIEVTDGNLEAYQRLWEAAMSGFDTDEAYYRVQGLNPDGTVNPDYEKLLDVDNLIDYMLTVYYTGDFDAPISEWENNEACNNFYAVYNRVDPNGFKFFRHDAEHSMMDLNEDRTGPFTASNLNTFAQFNPQVLHQKLVAHPEYTMRFADRAQRFMTHDGPMTPQGAISLLEPRITSIEQAMIAESARWGDAHVHPPRTRDNHWIAEITYLLEDYLPYRTDIVLDQLRARSWFPNIEAPELNINSTTSTGGQIETSDLLSMTASSGNIYYCLDGSDPRPVAHADQVNQTLELIPENGTKELCVPNRDIGYDWIEVEAALDQDTWTTLIPADSGTGAVGYDTGTDYLDTISFDLRNDMYGINGSCFLRYSFTVDTETLDGLNQLTLNVRCDDGFVAFLNGQEVASLNRPIPLSWNSTCANRPDSIHWVGFNLGTAASLLQSGENLLAVQAINQSVTSSDFLFSAQLTATEKSDTTSTVTETALLYSEPITLNQDALIKARAYDGTQWSTCTEAVFSVGTNPLPIRITEIMYHPLDTGQANDSLKEFVELCNVATTPVNLNGVRFTRGIRFSFDGIWLDPGERIVIVADNAAFEQRYGTEVRVAGVYEGRLSNGGERLTLVDMSDRIIHDFSYDDDWAPSTDGGGYSLVINNPETLEPSAWGQAEHWTAGTTLHGTPGQ